MGGLHVPTGAELRRHRAPTVTVTKEQQWASNVRDLHRVMDVTKNIYLNLTHSNEALVRVGVELATGEFWPKIFQWDNNWFDDDERRDKFRNLVASVLPKALVAVGLEAPPPVVNSDEEKRLRAALAAALKDAEEAREEAAIAKRAHEASRSEVEGLRAEVAERTDLNARLQAESRRLHTDLEQAEQRLKEAEEATAARIKALEDAHKKEMALQEAAAKHEISLLQTELKDANAAIAALKVEAENAKAAAKRVKELEDENARLMEEIKGLRASSEAAAAKVRDAERRAAAAEAAATQAKREVAAAKEAAAAEASRASAAEAAAAAATAAASAATAAAEQAKAAADAQAAAAAQAAAVAQTAPQEQAHTTRSAPSEQKSKPDSRSRGVQTDPGELEQLREEVERLRAQVAELKSKLQKTLEAAGEEGLSGEKIASIVAKVGLNSSPWAPKAIFDRLYNDFWDKQRRLEELREKYRAMERPPPGVDLEPEFLDGDMASLATSDIMQARALQPPRRDLSQLRHANSVMSLPSLPSLPEVGNVRLPPTDLGLISTAKRTSQDGLGRPGQARPALHQSCSLPSLGAGVRAAVRLSEAGRRFA